MDYKFETKEERKLRKKREKEEELDEDVLPTVGLYNPDGHLFYHASVAPMTKAQLKRAEEHGINLRSKKNFTLEESVQIFQNWRKFAEENNIQLNKALDYINVRKKEKVMVQHQEDHKFWVKLCSGLPHRSGQIIKLRAQNMLTDDFLESLDWNQLPQQIQEKFYKYETYDELTLKKMQKLMERGYASSYVADILDVPVSKAFSMTAKLRNLEAREDPTMISRFWESAMTFGLDPSKIRHYVELDDDYELDSLCKNFRISEISFHLHLSEIRCQELLKTILKMILDKFRESKNDGATDDEAWERAIGELSSKPPIEEHQIYKALEIFCQNADEEDTSVTLRQNKNLPKLMRTHGITNFQCDQPEFRYLHYRSCLEFMVPLERDLFQHLRRGFRFQLKLHCLLWSYKRLEVWEKLEVAIDKTRYEAVLEFELANPLASKITKKFLKNENVVEWIMEPRPPKHRRNAASRRLEAGVEAFLLYSHRKFKFPAKLRPLIDTSPSSTIQSIISEVLDSENSEFLSIKQVKNRVETASGEKIGVKIRNKAIVMRDEDSEDSDDAEEDSEVIARLLEHARYVKTKNSEEKLKGIENILEKADPSKIRKKFRIQNSEDIDEIRLNEEIHRQKKAMDRAVEAAENRKTSSRKRICSKPFVEDSDDSDDDVEDSEGSDDDSEASEDTDESEHVSKNSDDVHSEPNVSEIAPEASEDGEDSEPRRRQSQNVTKRKKRRRRDSEDFEIPEDIVEDSEVAFDDSDDVDKKKNKQKHRNSDDVPEDVEDSEIAVKDSKDVPVDSEDRTSKKKKKRKHRDSEDVAENSDDVIINSEAIVEGSEDRRSKKKKKRKHRDPEDVPEVFENSKDVAENSDDVTMDSEAVNKKKKKKRRHQDSEDVPEAVEGLEDVRNPDDVAERKKKKRKREDSEDVARNLDDVTIDSEAIDEASEVVPTDSERRTSRKKKKRKHQDSEDVAGNSDDVLKDSEVVSKKKKKKNKNRKIEDF